MALRASDRLGVYEIGSLLGAGGMGEVYRARDTTLGRDVALKILPASFTNDPERVARFRREAQVLASLNHPHVAQIHGLEEANSTQFLVLELVDGESLDKRIAGGPIPIDEALGIAKQIAEALEAAHEKGIIHRDLKPANIALTKDGQVKVLDFGLAKATDSTAGTALEVTNSPTITTPAMMTGVGVILGTAAYMSPEQAKGRLADKRSDVWAFGCILFEMVTGRRAFDGDDMSDVLATVLKTDPDWNALPVDAPSTLRTIIRRCLAKDRQVRIPDLSVVRFILNEQLSATDTAAPPAHVAQASRRWKWMATAACGVAVATLVGAYLMRPTASLAVARFFVLAPDKTVFIAAQRPVASAAISPDGRMLAFTARDTAGRTLLWVRRIDALMAQPLNGTDGAAFPFWSLDSRSIGFVAAAKLMKIAVAGGPPMAIATRIPIPSRGGTWSRDGSIVFSAGGGMFQVSAAGGEPTPLPNVRGSFQGGTYPSFLPDGRHLLYYQAGSAQGSGIVVASIDGGGPTRVVAADSTGIYDARTGRLLFARQGTLMAQAFNVKTFTLENEPVPIAERVEAGGLSGFPSFSVSDTGVLAYGTGGGTASALQLVWIDRQGKAVGTVGPPGNYRGIDISPDGGRVAAYQYDGQGGDIWIMDVLRGATSRFTFDASQLNSSPVWSPDGTQIAYGSLRAGKWAIYRKASNGARDEERLFELDVPVLPDSWSSDGRFIVFSSGDVRAYADLWALPLTGDRKPVPILRAPFQESHAQVSPDAKWVAYQSNETGRMEIYARPFPSGAGKWQLSTNGGSWPRWRRDSREVFYMATSGISGTGISGGKLMSVDVNIKGSTFEVGSPHELCDTGYINLPSTGRYHTFAVSPDGQRFLIPRPQSTAVVEASPPIVVVLNWASGLAK